MAVLFMGSPEPCPSMVPMERSWSNSCQLVEPDFTICFPSPPPASPPRYTESSEQVCFHGNHTVTQGFGTFSDPDYEYQMLPPHTNAEWSWESKERPTVWQQGQQVGKRNLGGTNLASLKAWYWDPLQSQWNKDEPPSSMAA
jgi:hypothetical protein